MILLGILIRTKKPKNEIQIAINRCRSFNKKSSQDEGPAVAIRQKIMKGDIYSDYKQTPVVNSLQEVYESIKGYTPGKLFTTTPPKGLYIYGSVGVGKTMLMDVFYGTIKMQFKRRVHFSDFMVDVHSRIHKLKKKSSDGKKPVIYDPIPPVARDLVREAWLLCFDEFQVTDIADAMILKRLFTEMFQNGMIMVATSNRSPEDLYKDGLQRSQFLPFIPVLKKYCKVVSLSGRDYRILSAEDLKTYYLLVGDSHTKSLTEAVYGNLCRSEGKLPSPRVLNILGHKLVFKNTCGRVLYAYFKDLCDRPLGPLDYIQIAKSFDTIIIKGVPKMDLSTRNQAKRFIMLIDTLYEYNVRVLVTAAVPPEELFTVENTKSELTDDERVVIDDLNLRKSPQTARTSLFSGSEEVFAFQRTVSRLNEMCSENYWARHKRRG